MKTGADSGTITLLYTVTIRQDDDWRREEVELLVRLMTTRFNVGRRWWFACPVAKHGQPCRRRTSMLYLPRVARLWACRDCYGLTYKVRQEHRQPGALDRLIAAEVGIPGLTLDQALAYDRAALRRSMRELEGRPQHVVWTDAPPPTAPSPDAVRPGT